MEDIKNLIKEIKTGEPLKFLDTGEQTIYVKKSEDNTKNPVSIKWEWLDLYTAFFNYDEFIKLWEMSWGKNWERINETNH